MFVRTCAYQNTYVCLSVAMSTSAPILAANVLHSMAADHTEDFRIYVLKRLILLLLLLLLLLLVLYLMLTFPNFTSQLTSTIQ